MSVFGEYLVKQRTSKGMSCNRVAVLAGLDQPTLSKVERGERRVTDDMLSKLAPVLGVPLEDLKREALRDRLDVQELEAAAEIAAEDASPQQAAHWVKVHFRKADMPPEAQEQFIKDMVELIKAADENWDKL